MNHAPTHSPLSVEDLNALDDDALLDLLADGELSPSQRGAVMARLARGATGWRGIAEALLARQALAAALPAPPAAAAVGPRWMSWRAAAAAAAAAIIAFTVGLNWRDHTTAPTGGAPPARHASASNPDSSPAKDALSNLNLHDDHLRIVFHREHARGVTSYATHQQLPLFMLHAIRDAGHDVYLLPQQVDVTLPDGEVRSVPVTETRIVPSIRREL